MRLPNTTSDEKNIFKVKNKTEICFLKKVKKKKSFRNVIFSLEALPFNFGFMKIELAIFNVSRRIQATNEKYLKEGNLIITTKSLSQPSGSQVKRC